MSSWLSAFGMTFWMFCGLGQISFADGNELRADVSTDVHAEIERLNRLWASWRDQVKTIRINGYRFTGLCSTRETAVSREEVHKLISETLVPWLNNNGDVVTSVTIDSLNSLPVGLMFPPLPEGDSSYARVGTGWTHFSLIEGPLGRRVDYESPTETKTVIRREGKEQTYSSKFKQASLLPSKSRERIEALTDFLHMPNLNPMKSVEIISPEKHSLTNRNGQHDFTIEFDPVSGFVYHDMRSLGEKGFVLERIQQLPLFTPSEPPVPKFSAQISYQTVKEGPSFLRKVIFYVVESVAFNVEESSDDLRLAAPEGTVIADFEHQVQSLNSDTGLRPMARKIDVPTKDALATANEAGFRIKVPSTLEPGGPRKKTAANVLIAFNVILVFLALFWWTMRRRPSLKSR